MAGVVEVHDRIVSQLHSRNAQLTRERSEAELRLKHATALLSELSQVWLDAPPKVAESIHKILANQGQRRGSGCPKEADDLRRQQNPAQRQWSFLSFQVEDLFGCTTGARRSEPVEVAEPPMQRPLAYPSRLNDMDQHKEQVPHDTFCRESTGNTETCEEPALMMPGSEVGDLLCDVPGAAALFGEIDAMCCALKRDAERSHKEFEDRISTLKAEVKLSHDRLRESFRIAMEAKSSELELCRSQLAQVTQHLVPRFALVPDLQLELCDSEWTSCWRTSESRMKAGQDHANWLEECLSVRVQSAEEILLAREQEFKQKLAALWERKCMLAARIRLKTGTGNCDGGPFMSREELAGLRKTLGDMEATALVPLKELATVQKQEEQMQFKRLKATILDARSQSKGAVQHLSTLAQRCSNELKSRLGSMNATILAHNRVERRHLLVTAFSSWLIHGKQSASSMVQPISYPGCSATSGAKHASCKTWCLILMAAVQSWRSQTLETKVVTMAEQMAILKREGNKLDEQTTVGCRTPGEPLGSVSSNSDELLDGYELDTR